jgi:hypothetical protein
MSLTRYQQVSAYFGELATYLGSFVLPDFSDLDIGGAIAEGTEEWSQQRADEFDAAVRRYNEEEERKRKVAAAERLRAERRITIDAADERLRSLPALPDAEARVVLPAKDVDAAARLIAAAEAAVARLDETIDADPGAFDDAVGKATDALDAAADAGPRLGRAIDAELKRRREVVAQLRQAAAVAQSGLAKDAEATLPPTQKCLVSLKRVIGEAGEKLTALEQAIGSSAPDAFAGDALGVDAAVRAIEPLVKIVNQTAESARKRQAESAERAAQEKRASDIADLRWTEPLPGEAELAVLPDTGIGKTLSGKKASYDSAFSDLERAPPQGFEAAKQGASEAYAGLEQAVGAAREAIRKEIAAREAALLQLRKECTTAGAGAGPAPIQGTEEADRLREANTLAERALQGVAQTLKTAAPSAFAKGCDEARAAIVHLGEVRGEVDIATGQRLGAVRDRRNELAGAATTARGNLPAGPTPEIVKAAKAALDSRIAADEKRIDGRDPKADSTAVADFKSYADSVTKLGRSLGTIAAPKFSTVASSAIIKDAVQKLLDLLNGKEGIGQSAETAAYELARDVGKVAERFAEIVALRQSYDDLIAHPGFDNAWKPEIAGFLDLESKRDTLDKGGLGNGVNRCTEAIDAIEKRARDRDRKKTANSAYAASDEGQFLVYMDENGRRDVCAEFARLVTTGTARELGISRAYLTSHDDELAGEFSVEIGISIGAGGRNALVVHAHCAGDGTPKPDNGCHFKLATNKRESGGTFPLTGGARGLLPGNDRLLRARDSM